MRKLLALWFWLINRGPWLVVGQWLDDDGTPRRFITARAAGVHRYGPDNMAFDNHDDAVAYASLRNEAAGTDPLGTVYYVCHKSEWRN